MSDETFLGRGLHASVWQTGDGSVVRKEYVRSNGLASNEPAEREFVSLERAGKLLSGVDRARVPQALSVEPDTGQLVMEFCPGLPLYLALRDRRFANHDEVESLAHTIAKVVVALSNELSLEELDISVRNTLLHSPNDELVFIDFTTRPLSVPLPPGVRRIEYILGGFVAGALSTSLHRSTILSFRTSRRLHILVKSLVDNLAAGGHINREHVREMAMRFYRHRGRSGGILRRIWFSSLAALIFRLQLWNAVWRSSYRTLQ